MLCVFPCVKETLVGNNKGSYTDRFILEDVQGVSVISTALVKRVKYECRPFSVRFCPLCST